MKIATHNGKFHPDDVIAIALLKLIHKDASVVRTRNPKIFEKADMRVDVGGKYNHETKDYDHHQKEGAGERDNKIPYASAGLIWKHYGKELVSSDEAWEKIDKEIIQYVDADDVGIKTYTTNQVEPYKIREIVLHYNPNWKNENDALYDQRFFELVEVFEKIMKVEIERVEAGVEGAKLVEEAIAQCDPDAEYMILEKHLPWKEKVITKTNLKFVVAHNPVEKKWAVLTVPKTLDNMFEYRKSLPEAWGGLADEALQKVTGVDDAVFCHRNLFLAVTKSKAGALKLVELALKE